MNQLFNIARRGLLGDFDWPATPFRMLAWDIPDYVFNEDHEVVNDIGAESAQSELLTNKVISPRGFAKSDAAWFVGPVPLATWRFYTLVADPGGDAGLRVLIAYYDTGVNIPRKTNGQDEILLPDWLAQQGWFRP